MKPLLVFAFVGLLAGCAQRPDAVCNVDPPFFCGPFRELADEMPESAKQELLALPKDQYVELHFGLGMYVRNRFGLWQDNEMTRYFRANGIDHPDTMSGPFIEGYVRYLQGQPAVMKQLLAPHIFPPAPPRPESEAAQ